MPHAHVRFELDVPPEEAFDFIADIRNEREWHKDLRSVEKFGDDALGEGTVFDTVYRGMGPMRIELHEYRRPRHLVFVGSGPRMEMRFAMDVEPRGAGSEVTFDIDMQPRGPARLFTPLLSFGLPREMAKRPQQFRDALARHRAVAP
jgi:carbon monoxide dehydrogenase subunit G